MTFIMTCETCRAHAMIAYDTVHMIDDPDIAVEALMSIGQTHRIHLYEEHPSTHILLGMEALEDEDVLECIVARHALGVPDHTMHKEWEGRQ